MKFKCKMMYLGCQKIHSNKKSLDYNVVGLMDLDNQTTYKIFVNDVQAVKFLNDYKLYNNYDFELSLIKNEKNGLLNLGVV